jgi:hypothetical protein
MTTNTEQLLREALHKIKHEAVSLADAQVIALEALTQPAQAAEGGEAVRDYNVKSSAGLIRPGKVDEWVANHYTAPPATAD